MSIQRLTQSILGAADKCLLSAQYTLDRPSWVKQVAGSQRALGTGFHAGLELYYRARMDEPALLPDLAEMIAEAKRIFQVSIETDLYDDSPVDVFKWDDKVPDLETADLFLEQMLTEYVMGEDSVWPPEYQVIGVEVHAELDDPEVGPQTKFGADLVLRDPDGGIIIDDHKTVGKAWNAGKEDPRKNIQAPFYQRLARRLYPDAPSYRCTFSIMTLPGKRTPARFERRWSLPEPRHEAAIVKKAVDFLAVYDEIHLRLGRDLPANPASTLCNPKWCDFFEGCAFGRALDDQTDMTVLTAPPALPAEHRDHGEVIANLRERCRTIVNLSKPAADYLILNLSIAGIDLRAAEHSCQDIDGATLIVQAAERECSAPFNDMPAALRTWQPTLLPTQSA